MDSNGTAGRHLSRPIEIVFLLQDLEFGGSQRYALHMVQNLDRNIFSPHLWVLRGGMDMVPTAHAGGTKPFWLSKSSFVGPRALTHLAFKLMQKPPDILYTLTVVPNIWGRLFGTLAKVPVIVTSMRDLYPKQYESWMWPLSTRIICNAHVLKDVIIERYRVHPERIAVVPNAVDPHSFTPEFSQKASEPTVLYVGRLAKEKDLITLLEAFRLTLQRIPNARLDMLGNGADRRKLETFIRRHSLESRVRLIAGQTDPRPLYKQAWVFAMSSVREAAPNVLLEAMATELPVVGTSVGGIPELAKDGETGIIVEPSNPTALAGALVRLLTDEELRRAMGKRGRERVLRFHTLDGMVAETQNVLVRAFHEAINSNGNGHRPGRPFWRPRA